MARKLILPEQTITFSYNPFVSRSISNEVIEFTFEVGSEYIVIWDDVEYKCTAFEGSTVYISPPEYIAIGNKEMIFGGSGNGEPNFVFIKSIGDSTDDSVAIHTIDDGESHKIEIYKEIEGANVVLKDMKGNNIVYGSTSAVKLNMDDGSKQIFSKGEAISKNIALDFSDGDMIVSDENKLFSSVNILKPEMLLPENIANGVEIAGVVGELASGGNCKIAYGLWKGVSESVSCIMHGLGVVPDIVIIARTVNTKNAVSFAFGISTEFYNYLNQKSPYIDMSYYGWKMGYYTLCSSSGSYSSYICEEEIDVATSGPGIHNTTAESFSVGSTTYNTGGRWIAISGLTNCELAN